MMKCGSRQPLLPATRVFVCPGQCPPLGVLWPMLFWSLASSFFITMMHECCSVHKWNNLGAWSPRTSARLASNYALCVHVGAESV